MDNLEKLLTDMLPYIPRIYTQASYKPSTDETVRTFELVYKFTVLPSDCLIFFVPTQNSVDGTNTLTFKIPSALEGDNITYQNVTFNIVIETNDGNTRRAGKGDIVAYRLCTFRFAKGNTNNIILTNSPAYNALQISQLTATNAKFLNVPQVGTNSLDSVALATQADLTPLVERINSLEGKILWGVDDPEQVLASKENGTIYVQVEEE